MYMELSLRVQAAEKSGNMITTTIMEFADVTSTIQVTSTRFDSPSKMTFTCIERGNLAIPEGSSVELTVDGQKVFKGYVFTAVRSRDGETQYTAYDQLRYLKASASYTFVAQPLEDIIRRIAADFNLEVGTLEETGYSFPCLIKENETCLDIIFEALSQTIIQTGRIFNFYDNAGTLSLTEAKNMYTNQLIGTGSLLTEYQYKRDIDAETYNRIKLVRPNRDTGRADTYIYQDSDTIEKWGLLQYYDTVDENMNAAQIEQMCQQYLQYYNRVLQTVSLESMGILGVRAGSIVPVRIEDVGDLSAIRLLIAEKVIHTFEGNQHTMKVEVKSFSQLGGISVG